MALYKVAAREFMKLKAGDIRQVGDMVRSLRFDALGIECRGELMNYWTTDEERRRIVQPKAYTTIFSNWHPVRLIGWPILKSDLMHAEFKRGN